MLSSNRIEKELVKDALRMAMKRGRAKPGLIFHSDRGSQSGCMGEQCFRKKTRPAVVHIPFVACF